MAALEVFQLAFPLPHLPATFGRWCNHHPLSEQVALLIKTFPPQVFSAEWELLALYGCCDVFLLLHRSEGFGRGMAEALQLGVDLIATDFGGNTDFCSGPLAHPLRRWSQLGGTGSGACGGAVPPGGGAASESGYPRISGCGRSQP
jgi:glycosyltransferase involved in cell wall biosynthesis